MTARIDFSKDEASWFQIIENSSNENMYFESLIYVFSTINGASFSAIVPSTNLEWGVSASLSLFGCFLLTCILIDFLVGLRPTQNQGLEKSLLFAQKANLPQALTNKIRYFYSELHFDFQDKVAKHQLLQKLPSQLRQQAAVLFNKKLIEQVNIFQFAPSGFISEICQNLKPELCLCDDLITQIADEADKMYFVHSGSVEVLSQKGAVLATLEAGGYFGEIGLFNSGKRTASVKAKENTIVYTILKADLDSILESYPQQGQYLKAVASQRLQTTPIETSLRITPLRKQKQLRNKSKCQKLECKLIKPLSAVWWLQNLTLALAVLTNALVIPYTIAFEHNLDYNPILITTLAIYCLDLPMRSRTSQAPYHKSRTSKWFVVDILATFPFEYIVWYSGNQAAGRWILLLRLVKLARVVETLQVIRKNSQLRLLLPPVICLYGILVHWQACGLAYLSLRSEELTLFTEFEKKPFVNQGSLIEMPQKDQYIALVYLSSQVMQQASYGDILPYTVSEKVWVLCFLTIANLLKVYLLYKVAECLACQYRDKLERASQSNRVQRWLKSQKLDFKYRNLVHLHMSECQTVQLFENSQIFSELPLTLRQEISRYLEQPQRTQKSGRLNKIQKDSGRNSRRIVGPNKTKDYVRMLKFKHVIEWAVLICVVWNLVFDPAQFAFKIKFSLPILVVDMLPKLLYLIEILCRLYYLTQLKTFQNVESQALRQKDLNITRCQIFQVQERKRQLIQIAVTAVAMVPFSFVIQMFKGWDSQYRYYLVILVATGLIKLKPVIKFFRQKQKRSSLKLWRILQAVFFYLVFCHFATCVMVFSAVHEQDWNLNWLAKCPVPQKHGFRISDDHSDLSMGSVYIHAFYFVAGTVSRVAIGDIVALHPNEIIAQSVFAFISTFIYCYLFAEIVSAVGLHTTNYNCGRQSVLDELPTQLQKEFTAAKFSYLLKDTQFEVAQNFMRSLDVETYSAKDFVLKLGRLMNEGLIVLEGSVSMVTVNQEITQQKPGFYFSTDLGTDTSTVPSSNMDETQMDRSQDTLQIFKQTALPERSMNDLDGRSPIHLVASSPRVKVGWITKDKLDLLCIKHPTLATNLAKQSRKWFEKGLTQVEQLLKETSVEQITHANCTYLVKQNFEQKTKDDYTKIATKVEQFLLNRERLKKFFLEPRGIVEAKILPALTLLNSLYIGLVDPFLIGFNQQIQGGILACEIVSHTLAFICFSTKVFVPVQNLEGELSIHPRDIFRSRKKYGLILDIIAFLPFSLIIPYVTTNVGTTTQYVLFLVLQPLRTLRILNSLRSWLFLPRVVRGPGVIVLLSHWLVCTWIYLSWTVEQRFQLNFQSQIYEKQLWEAYLRNAYAMAQLVSSVGNTDVYATTDPERAFFVFTFVIKDVLWAVVIGVVLKLALSARRSEITKCTRSVLEPEVNKQWQDRVVQCLEYQPRDNSNSSEALDSLFTGFQRKNLTTDLHCYLKTEVCLPDSALITQNAVQERLWIVTDGFTRASAPHTAAELVKEQKAQISVHAETFVTAKVLMKADFDRVVQKGYPTVGDTVWSNAVLISISNLVKASSSAQEGAHNTAVGESLVVKVDDQQQQQVVDQLVSQVLNQVPDKTEETVTKAQEQRLNEPVRRLSQLSNQASLKVNQGTSDRVSLSISHKL